MSQPGQNPQQPISFKTVPGRNRTQKWTQAKTNNYDGDEWGSYDDYDDYGGHDEPTSAHQQQGQYGQLQRQPSFDRGIDAERRQFSSGTQQEHYTSPVGGSGRIAQDIQSPHSPDEARRRMREFSNPGQVPQPLNTPRSPQAPGSAERPPRDSSLRSDSPAAEARPIPAATSPSTNKALPFVRPSDIYKRMAEEKEKERQSSESGRPSMDVVQKDIGSPSTAQNTLTHKKSRESLPSGSPTGNSTTSPELPSITGGSAFGMHPIQTGVQPSTVSQPSAMHVQNNSTQLPPVNDVSGTGSFMPRDEEERLSATGLAASTAAAGAAASALATGSRDITPTMPSTQSQASSDPAAEIAAERTTNAPVEQLGRAPGEDPSGLSHQPSSGFRSVVHKAFDGQGDGSTPDSPISRENTHSVVSRTDTNSTRSISPIMSRVPSAATAQQRQQERDAVVPSIAEEEPLEIARSRPMSGATTQTVTSRPSILRKPTPNHSRNVSSEVAGFTPGYRRSMETPSPNNSPARTPGIADVDTRRFSGPMAAETVTTAEPPDVSPDAPEAPSATLEPVETPSETPDPTIANGDASEVVKPLPTTGRGRSGTNYSLRESDLAKEVSNSPEERSAVAEAAANERQLFLDTHPVGPASPRTMSPTALSPTALSPTGFARPFPHPAASGSGRNSPAGNSRSRVRNIVDQFHQIDEDSRRNSAASSKSSWSNFAGEEDPSPGIVKRTTGGSMLSQESPAETSMFPSYDNADQDGAAASSTIRPEPERQESFRPHLPGEWVSATATPASEVPSVPAPDIFRGRDQTSRDITPTANPTPKADQVASPGEEVDLTPTTKKTKLPSNDRAVSGENDNPLSAVKDAGEALGTALMSHMGYGHQTQDFASKDKPAPVDIPEMQPHRPTGNIDDYMNPPQLNREHSDAPSEATNSVANSIPPTPLSKGTPEPAGLGVAAAPPSEGRPVSNYFSGYNPDAPAPLSFGKNSPRTTPREFESERPTVLPTMSTDTGTGDFESDRLRKDIVRSLSPGKMAELKREGALDDVARTQDALDAPTNERRVASGESALPAAETKNSDARSGLPSQSRPGLLGQRFSWENRSADDDLYGHMAVVGETKGDENRESFGRPHSNGGLHVVNTEVQAADSEPTTAEAGKQSEPGFLLSEPADAEKRLSASLPVGTTALATGNQSDTLPELSSPIAEDPTRSLDHVAPTPITEDDTAPTNLAPPPPPSDLKEDSPTIPSSYTAATTKPNPSTTSQKDKDKDRIPPFRDLAAIKSVPDRIAAYEHTRGRFANMNTGLNGWLSTMLAANPEYADAANQKYEGPAVIQSSGIGGTISGLGLGGTIRGHGHKHSPSILKIGGGGAGGGERKGSAASLGTSSAAGTGMPESSSGGGSGGGGHVDVEKMQAKGKDFLKGAGAGAKGLFAKGKSRFGRSEKAPAPSSSSLAPNTALTTAPAPSPLSVSALPAENNNKMEHSDALPAPAPTTAPQSELKHDEVMSSDCAAAAGAAGAAIERPRSVFDRLRDGVSRSRSRSGKSTNKSKSPAPSRPVSRAASGLMPKDDSTLDLAPVTAADPAPASAPASAPAPVHGHGHSHAQMDLGSMPEPFAAGLASPLPEAGERRREAWEDEDAEVGDARWRVEGDRLGVLPSPSVLESPVRSGSESEGGGARKGSWIGGVVVPEVVVEVRGKEGEGEGDEERKNRGVGAAGGAGGDVPVASAQIEENNAEPVPLASAQGSKEAPSEAGKKVSPVPIEPSENTAPLPKPVQTRSASFAAPSSAAATRPQPERKFSALDELPSQQRRRQFTPVATPRRLSLADDGTMAAKPPLGARPESTVDDDKPKISRPPTPAKWDLLSTVAASAPPVQTTASRRSSISSLGDPRSLDNVLASEEKRRSVVGFPAGTDVADDGRRSVSPLPGQEGPLDLAGAVQGNQFMNRPYGLGQAMDQRPMSYMILSSESLGQEAMGMPPQQEKRFSTPGDFAGYSVPGMMESPQEQRIPSGPPSRTPSIGLPPKEYDRLRSPQPGDEEPFPGDTSSRQSSGFFRGPGQPAAVAEPSSRRSSFFRGPDLLPAPGPGMIPSPSRVDENFNGLVDPQVSEFSDDIVRSEQQEQPQKQSRRKSGIMDTFRRASTHSMTASRPSSRGSMAKIAATNGNEGTMAKSKTLKKPQRATSSAVEPKNKRLSRLGSLFRRSSSAKSDRAGDRASKILEATPEVEAQATSTGTAAPRKLTKAAPPPRQPSQPQPYYTAPPRPGNYAAYEAMMRQQAGQHIPPQHWQQPVYADPAMMSSPYQQQMPPGAYNQQQPSGYYQQGPPVGLQQQYPASASSSRTHSLVGNQSGYQNQPVEYYSSPQAQSPAAYPLPSSQPASPMQGQARPQVRRLHSENHRRRDTVPDIPEVSSPVLPSSEEPDTTRDSAGYGQVEQTQRPVAPELLLQNGQTGPARPNLSTRQSSGYSQTPVLKSPVGVQPLGNMSQSPGQQDGQPQYWQQPPRTQRVSPPASPIQTQRMPQQQYTGSIDQQIARSPARDHQGQQTPWSISLPQGQDSSYRNHDASSWEMQQPARSPQQYYTGPPAAARGAVRSSSPPQHYHDQYSHMTPYHFVPPPQAQRPTFNTQQRSSSYGFEQAAGPRYFTPQDQGYTYGPQQHYPPQQRYYGHQRQTSWDSQGRPVAQHQRTASSYSGRRDDTGVSEAEIMRGVSYPGQEWTPGRI